MDKKRKLTLIVFYLLMMVFSLDLVKAYVSQVAINHPAPQPTVEEQIEKMNTRLSQIEILEFRKNKMVDQEEEKIRDSKTVVKLLKQDLEKLDKEKSGLIQKKLVLKLSAPSF